MIDSGHNATDEMLAWLERDLAALYSEAAKDVTAKLEDYLRRFAIKDQTWKGWVEDGKKTKEEYIEWRKGQMMAGKRWEETRDSLAKDLARADRIAVEIIGEYKPDVYAENFNFGTYEVEKGAKLDTSFTLYNRDTVAKLMKDNPDLLPGPGRKATERIKAAAAAIGKDIRWNKQHIQSAVLQGIVQGESIPKIAGRLEMVAEMDHRTATRNARTSVTSAENIGREHAYERAEDMGINMIRMWQSVLDMRTRHEHRMLDGEQAKVGEPFVVPGSGEEIMYPGDPSAEPYMVYNCRCRTRGIVDGLEPQARKYRSLDGIDGMTYEEWKQSKVERPNPILLPEEKSEAIRQVYIAEYRRG